MLVPVFAPPLGASGSRVGLETESVVSRTKLVVYNLMTTHESRDSDAVRQTLGVPKALAEKEFWRDKLFEIKGLPDDLLSCIILPLRFENVPDHPNTIAGRKLRDCALKTEYETGDNFRYWLVALMLLDLVGAFGWKPVLSPAFVPSTDSFSPLQKHRIERLCRTLFRKRNGHESIELDP